MKKFVSAIIIILLLGLTAISLTDDLTENPDYWLTGQFTEASPIDSQESSEIENIYWNFEDGKTILGPIARHNISEGTQKVAITIETVGGQNTTYIKQLKVKR